MNSARIVGVGESPLGKVPDLGATELQHRAAHAALEVRIGLRVRVLLKPVAEGPLPAFEPDGNNQPGDSNDG